jgi:hypothetical protein
MVQFIDVQKKPSFTDLLGQSIGQTLQQRGASRMQQEALRAQEESRARLLEKEYQLKGGLEKQKYSDKLLSNQKIISDIEKKRGLPEGSLQAYADDPKMAEQISRPTKEKEQPLTAKEVPKDISSKIKKTLADNPKATADELRISMDEAGIPPVYSNPYTENRRRQEEQSGKVSESKKAAMRAETLPIRTDLAKKAQAASKGIQNKEELLNIIEKGNINDPTFAALAESLPLNLGKRLLSNDTVEYKAGLVEEFTDLRNIFQGQTRIKEIDLLENKIADLYLTDEQKKAVIKSRINALKADMIRAEAAGELEDRDDLGVLQFNNEVERIAKPKLEALFNQVLDEQKSIISSAESRKSLPLNPDDPEDLSILQQILREAGGDKKKAREIAAKKGYKF